MPDFEIYSDSDYRRDNDERKSTLGYLFKFLGASTSWRPKKQEIVVMSSCEAEYMATFHAAQQALWLELVMDDMKIEYKKPLELLVDNQSTISLAHNPVAHGRTKHIESRFH